MHFAADSAEFIENNKLRKTYKNKTTKVTVVNKSTIINL